MPLGKEMQREHKDEQVISKAAQNAKGFAEKMMRPTKKTHETRNEGAK